MKRVIAILLVLVLAISTIGCGSGNAQTTQTAPASESDSAKSEIKIGFSYNQFSDSLGMNAQRAVQKAADTLGVEVIFNEDKGDSNAQIAAVENMISAGVDGILISPASDAVLPQIGELCKNNEVWLMTCFRDIISEDVIAAMKDNPYYLGTVCEAEAETAVKMVDMLQQEGHTQVGAFYAPPGEACTQQRKDAYIAQSEADGMTIKADYVVSNMADLAANATEAISMFLESYPEITATMMVAFAGGMGEAAVASIKSHNAVGKMKMVGFDSFTKMDEAFDEGLVAAVATAHHADPFFAFMVLYNAVSGHRLSEEQVHLTLKYILVTSSEECRQLNDYLLNEEVDLYTEDEIKAMTVESNPAFTLEDLKKAMDAYTLEDVIARIDARK